MTHVVTKRQRSVMMDSVVSGQCWTIVDRRVYGRQHLVDRFRNQETEHASSIAINDVSPRDKPLDDTSVDVVSWKGWFARETLCLEQPRRFTYYKSKIWALRGYRRLRSIQHLRVELMPLGSNSDPLETRVNPLRSQAVIVDADDTILLKIVEPAPFLGGPLCDSSF